MEPLVNTFVSDFAYIESCERLQVNSACMWTNDNDIFVHIALTFSYHLAESMVGRDRVRERPLYRGQIDC